MKWGTSDVRYNTLDLFFKVIAGVFILVGFYFGLKQFKISSESEYKKIYYTNQIQYINHLIETTSELCKDSLTKSQLDSLSNNFRSLYYGKAEFYLDDGKLKTAISVFSTLVDYRNSGITKVPDGAPSIGRIKEQARSIAQLAKEHIDNIYKVKIADVELF